MKELKLVALWVIIGAVAVATATQDGLGLEAEESDHHPISFMSGHHRSVRGAEKCAGPHDSCAKAKCCAGMDCDAKSKKCTQTLKAKGRKIPSCARKNESCKSIPCCKGTSDSLQCQNHNKKCGNMGRSASKAGIKKGPNQGGRKVQPKATQTKGRTPVKPAANKPPAKQSGKAIDVKPKPGDKKALDAKPKPGGKPIDEKAKPK